jgi:hypothetical protein
MTPLPHSQVGSPPTWTRFRRLPSPVPSRGPSIGCQPTLQGIQKKNPESGHMPFLCRIWPFGPQTPGSILAHPIKGCHSRLTLSHQEPSLREGCLYPLTSMVIIPSKGMIASIKRVVQTLPCRSFLPPLPSITPPPKGYPTPRGSMNPSFPPLLTSGVQPLSLLPCFP